MDTRRSFFASLVTGGATVAQRPQARNRREHHTDTKVYHGPLLVPAHIAEAVRESPDLARSTCRHLVARYADPDGTVWRFRCRVPDHRAMVGEIVLTCDGAIRIHCWSAADPGSYREPGEIMERWRGERNP